MIIQRDFCCPLTGNPCEDPRCSDEDCVHEPDRMSPEYRADSKRKWEAFVKELEASYERH